MRISTKTLTSLMLVTAVAAAVPGISRMTGSKRRQESQFERLLQRHDRKGELRADVLGLDVLEFKDMQRRMSLDEIAQRRGFATKRAFRLALLGKMKNELRMRGWTAKKIDQFILSRSSRIG